MSLAEAIGALRQGSNSVVRVNRVSSPESSNSLPVNTSNSINNSPPSINNIPLNTNPSSIQFPSSVASLSPNKQIQINDPPSSPLPKMITPMSPTISNIPQYEPVAHSTIPGFLSSPRSSTTETPKSPRSLAPIMFTPMSGLIPKQRYNSKQNQSNGSTNVSISVPTAPIANITNPNIISQSSTPNADIDDVIPVGVPASPGQSLPSSIPISPNLETQSPLSPRQPLENVMQSIESDNDIDDIIEDSYLTRELSKMGLKVIERVVVQRGKSTNEIREEVHYVKVRDDNDNVYYIEIDMDIPVDINDCDIRAKYVQDPIVPYRVRKGDYQSAIEIGANGVIIECKNQIVITRKSSRQTEPMELALEVISGSMYPNDYVQYPLIRISHLFEDSDAVATVVDLLIVELRQLRVDECLNSDIIIQDLITNLASVSDDLIKSRRDYFNRTDKTNEDIKMALRLCKINSDISTKINDILSIMNDLKSMYS